MWRYLDISGENYNLCIKNKNFCIQKKDSPDVLISASDINAIAIHGRNNTISEAFFEKCMEYGIPVTFCDDKHLPTGMLLPYNQHIKAIERILTQFNASLPRKKQAWKKVVAAKIKAQAEVLHMLQIPESTILFEKSKRVKSGDSTNEESQAARIYFAHLFGEDFVRHNDEDIINALLNYGYTVLRSMVARSICTHGLNPGLSIFHSNRINNFALVDDLMEPLRPFVDFEVAKLIVLDKLQINPENKKRLISIIRHHVLFDGGKYEMKDAINLYVMDYYHFINSDRDEIRVPLFDLSEEIIWL